MLFLVVESSLSVRESLCLGPPLLWNTGIPMRVAHAAVEALTRGDIIDGAIIDIDNKAVDGVQLINDLKSSDRTRGMSIIVHTVQSSKELVMNMVGFGVAGYLLKPFKPRSCKGEARRDLLQALHAQQPEAPPPGQARSRRARARELPCPQ